MLTQEQLWVILLDTRNRVLDVLMIYQGNVNSTIVRMAEVFRDAIVVCAPNVILVHNHWCAARLPVIPDSPTSTGTQAD